MVKNTHGGSGHKKFARKNTTGPKSNRLRTSEDEGEIYAIVTKLLGNGMFHCHCIDVKVRLGHIRGKFSYRTGKRDNMVQVGKWVLVGLREWDTSDSSSCISKQNEKFSQCDLLEVYTDTDKQRLKETVNQNWAILETNDVTKITSGITSELESIIFATDQDYEREILIQEIKSSTANKITLNVEDVEEEEVDFDDI